MNKNKKIAFRFLLGSIFFIIAGIIVLYNKDLRNSNTLGILLITIGSLWSAIGSAIAYKYQKLENNSSNNQNKLH
ncbi:hypothetical protein [Helcococcus ovis]|uniref:hypothetical protein n=1 Tax=Helcococcus ovis TaxID=72026 RepID=UPI0038BCCBDD